MENLNDDAYKELIIGDGSKTGQRKRRFSQIETNQDIENGAPATKLHEIELQNKSDQTDYCQKNIDILKSNVYRNKSITELQPEPQSTSCLDDCCDEILIEILKFLPTKDLLSIMKTCKRLERISKDKRLWLDVCVTYRSNTYDKLLFILKCSKDVTKRLRIRGPEVSQRLKSSKNIENFTKCLRDTTLNCQQLKVLEMYAIEFDMKWFKLEILPTKLNTLIMCGCTMVNNLDNERPSWFRKIHSHLISLEVLRIEYCTWFYPDDIMSISKLPELQTLSLRGCVRFFDIVAYGSIASLYGFKKLKSLDLRHIPLRDSDLQCFNAVYTLREIKLERHPFRNENKPQSEQLLTYVKCTDDTFIPIQCPPLISLDDNHGLSLSNELLEGNSRIIYVDLRSALNRNNGTPEIIIQEQAAPYINAASSSTSSSQNNNNNNENLFRSHNLLTNLSVCSFGSATRQVQPHRIWISVRQRPKDTQIERFIVRHYKDITDEFLSHIEQCTPNIKYLDVSGTSCTAKGIENFQNIKPGCTVIAEHLV